MLVGKLRHPRLVHEDRAGALRLRPCAALPASKDPVLKAVVPSKILLLGGTGRVGSSTAASLLQLTPQHYITLAGRRKEGYQEAVKRRPVLDATRFEQIDIQDREAVASAAAEHDLVIHTAGPFQRSKDLSVLEACIAVGTPYIDVCDDQDYSVLTKGLHDQAVQAGVPCITTAGIYPGVSNVMAAHMCSLARKEYDAEMRYRVPENGEGSEPQRLLYSYYTAGTGGVGPTILETTFLLAGEPTIAYKDGKEYVLPPVSERRCVDFGPGLRKRDVWLYNLPEVKSSFKVLGIPSVSARFGTSPDIWNWATWLLARLAPQGFLQDRRKVKMFVKAVDPIVRATDAVAGEAVGMLVELQFDDSKEAVGIFVHKRLSETVGSSTAAFAEAILTSCADPGVWYPEEKGALTSGAARMRLLQRASQGYDKPCYRFDLNKTLWQIESDPKYLAMGMYF
eukprot:jgi/Ulvmu1/5747/UM025_0001.1